MKNTKIYKDLVELENAGEVDYDISYRGGHYGLPSEAMRDLLGIPDKYEFSFARKTGVFSNYLGGGLRGAVTGSGYSKDLPKKYADKVDAFIAACKRRYIELEGDLNNEVDENGDENWDAIGTQKSRDAGIVSGY